jgi:hypothetical protein
MQNVSVYEMSSEVIEVIDYCNERHRTTTPEKDALEAAEPRQQRTLGCGPGAPGTMQFAHCRRITGLGDHGSQIQMGRVKLCPESVARNLLKAGLADDWAWLAPPRDMAHGASLQRASRSRAAAREATQGTNMQAWWACQTACMSGDMKISMWVQTWRACCTQIAGMRVRDLHTDGMHVG